MITQVCDSHVCEILIPLLIAKSKEENLYLNFNSDIEQKLIEFDIKNHFHSYDTLSQEKMKNALKYSINRGNEYCLQIVDSLLIDLSLPDKDYQKFMIIIWKILFGSEEYHLDNIEQYHLTTDPKFCHSLRKRNI